MTSLNGKDYRTPKSWKNITKYQVGQIWSGQIITAILRVTDNQFAIYSYPCQQTIKLDEYKKCQEQRERGGMNVNVPGRLLLMVNLKNNC